MSRSVKRGRPRTAGITSSSSFSHVVLQLRNYVSLTGADTTTTTNTNNNASTTAPLPPSKNFTSTSSQDASMHVHAYVPPNGATDGMILVAHDQHLSLWGTWTLESLGLPTLLHRRRVAPDNSLSQKNIVSIICGVCQGQVHVVCINGSDGQASLQLHSSNLRSDPHIQPKLHSGGRVLAVAYHPQRCEIVTAGVEGHVKVWVVSCAGTGTLDNPHSTEKKFRARQRLTITTRRHFKEELNSGGTMSDHSINALVVDHN